MACGDVGAFGFDEVLHRGIHFRNSIEHHLPDYLRAFGCVETIGVVHYHLEDVEIFAGRAEAKTGIGDCLFVVGIRQENDVGTFPAKGACDGKAGIEIAGRTEAADYNFQLNLLKVLAVQEPRINTNRH